jgi:hypothetical protein
VLILPPGHMQAARVRRPLSLREKRLIGLILAVVAALIVAFVVSLASGGRASARGCIYLTLPAVTGAQQINECGAQARDTCSSVHRPGAFNRAGAEAVAAACRRAGLPVGR